MRAQAEGKIIPILLILLLSTLLSVKITNSTAELAQGLWVEGKDLAWLVSVIAIAWALTAVLVGMARLDYGLVLLLAGYPIINRTFEFLNLLVGPVLLNVFNLTLLCLGLRAAFQFRELMFNRTDKWLLGFVVLALVPTIAAQNPLFAIRGYISGVLEPLLLYLLLRLVFRTRVKFQLLIAAIASFVLIHFGIIAAEAFRAGSIRDLVYARVEGGFMVLGGLRVFSGGLAEPKQAAMIILLLLPIFLFLGPGIGRRQYTLIAIGLVIEILISLSRVETALLFATLLLGYLVARRWQFNHVRRLLLLIFMMTFVLSILTLPLLISRFGSALNAGSFSDPNIFGGMNMDVTSVYYFSIIYSSFDLLLAHPFGIGAYNGLYYSLEIGRRFPWLAGFSPSITPITPHVTTAIAFGVLPTVFFIALLVNLTRETWRIARQGMNPFDRACGAGLSLTIIINGLLASRIWPIAVGGYSFSGDFFPGQFPQNQQAIWSFVVLALASSVAAGVLTKTELHEVGVEISPLSGSG